MKSATTFPPAPRGLTVVFTLKPTVRSVTEVTLLDPPSLVFSVPLPVTGSVVTVVDASIDAFPDAVLLVSLGFVILLPETFSVIFTLVFSVDWVVDATKGVSRVVDLFPTVAFAGGEISL